MPDRESFHLCVLASREGNVDRMQVHNVGLLASCC